MSVLQHTVRHAGSVRHAVGRAVRGGRQASPASFIWRSSFFISDTSSRSRAAISNWRSAAAARIRSVNSSICSASSAAGRSVGTACAALPFVALPPVFLAPALASAGTGALAPLPSFAPLR